MYPEPTARSRFVVAARLLIPAAVLLWLIEAVDVVLFSDRLESHGIEPRQVDGLEGILFSPFLHDDVGHLVANTAPFLVLGALVMASGMKTFWQVTIGAALIGGSATWLLARQGNHIGASLVIFGYFGFLVVDGFIGRSLRSVAIAVLAALLYGSILWGALPTAGAGVSWEGHLFGLIAGGYIAYARSKSLVSSNDP
ncbi:MAG: rhomboid family intramembrane serine protease [Acidimicrobiia bacterium]|nr:rhomboid family intramembrane serine protease [Acidimicrobiia bacterium]